MSETPAQFVVSVFQSEEGADQALKQIVEAKREHLIKILGAAVIRCDAAGKLHISERGDLSTGQGAGSGAAIGAAIGLFGGPLAVLLGGSIGAAIGAIAGRLLDTGLPDARLKQIGAALKPGTSALIALIEHTWVDELQAELDRLGGDILAQAVTNDIAQQLEAGREVAYSAVAAAGGTITTRTTTGADGVSIAGVATDGTSLVAGAATLTVTDTGEASPTATPPAAPDDSESLSEVAPTADPAPKDVAS